MSDAAYVEISRSSRKKSFFKSRLGLFCLFMLLVAFMVLGCWIWLANGKLTSVYANVDAAIYTVEPEAAVTVREVLVQKGAKVFPGQPLAMIELLTSVASNSQKQVNLSGTPMGEISNRLNESELLERGMSARISQARLDEERYQQAHQQAVTEHVRAQLALRAANPANPALWAAATANEQAARARMEVAREQFENVSKMRAAMDAELARIRFEIQRDKNAASRSAPAPRASRTPQARPPVSKPETIPLLAPANGSIIQVLATPGQQAQAGQPLFYIMPTSQGQPADCWIQAWYPLAEHGNLKPGQKALIKIGEWTFAGQISAVVTDAQALPTAAPMSGNEGDFGKYAAVRIIVDEPQALAEIGPGAAATCIVQTHSLPWLNWL